MNRRILTISIACAGLALGLSGCATTESVQRAQATADQALSLTVADSGAVTVRASQAGIVANSALGIIRLLVHCGLWHFV